MPDKKLADFGLIGLAVMGQNFVLNGAEKGYTVAVYNRTTAKMTDFVASEEAAPFKERLIGCETIESFVKSLKRPRRAILLVKAGQAVDDFIAKLLPYMEKGDIIIDAGNSHYPDSNRRTEEFEKKGLLFIGTGISGGEEGARNGPSIMPGGSKEAWPEVKEIFQSMAAKSDGEPCCQWVGDAGAGHYVKQTHNGIEYGDMQMISEVYQILRSIGCSNSEMADIFEKWNTGVLDSYLIEITYKILRYKDQNGDYVIDKILDSAGQKGTGKWTAINALDLGMPVTLIGEAVFSRCLSALKGERQVASKLLAKTAISNFADLNISKEEFIDSLEQALYASKIISYAQGFMLLRQAAKEYNWELNYGGIALMWRGGCIIRSVFLKRITDAYEKNPELESLLFANFFKTAIEKAQKGWRTVVTSAINMGISIPAISSALSFYDGYVSEKLPANMIQAQRDFFGAHTFKVLPSAASDLYPVDKDHHVNWTGIGGKITSSSYQA